MMKNLLLKIKQHSAVFALVTSFALLTAIGITAVDWNSVINEQAGNPTQAFDSAASGDNQSANGGTKEGLSFKKIVTAPVRLIARMFRRNDTSVAKTTPVPTATTTDTAVSNAIDREAGTMFDQAVEAHGKKQLETAIAKLIAVVGMQPNNAEAYNLLGVCYDEKGQYAEAQDEYKKAIKIEPINARFLNNLGYSYYLIGKDKQAIKWYQKALKFTPGDNRLQNNLGLAYGRRGEFAKAKDQFIKAVGEHGALLNMGYIYSNQGRYQQAIEQFEEALKLQPNSMVAMSSLAQVYDRVGRVRDAEMLTAQYKKLTATSTPVANQTAEKKNEQEEEDK